jgi:aromatic-L-amino-acid decarboxylase
VLRTYGSNGLKAHIRRTVKLGEDFAALIKGRPDLFRILTPPAFALTVIQVLPKEVKAKATTTVLGATDDHDHTQEHNLTEVNELTKKVHEAIFAEGKLFLTSTVVAGHYCIRVVSSNPKSEFKYLQNAFEVLVQTAEKFRA